MTTPLLDSPYSEGHAFSSYVNNLRNHGSSISWFSARSSMQLLRDYVWSLMDLAPNELRYAEEGFAQPADGSILFIGGTSPKGSILTCFPLNNGSGRGVQLVTEALEREWNTMREELSRGAYVGNRADAWNVVVSHGQVREDFEGSDVFDYINGAQVADLRP